MGCMCSKGTFANDFVSESHRKSKKVKVKNSSKELGSILSAEESVAEVDRFGNDAPTIARSVADPTRKGNTVSNGSLYERAKKATTKKASKSLIQRRRRTVDPGPIREQGQPRIVSLTKGETGAQIVAGWPCWLASIAGEAINGWVPRRADSFEKMDKIGQGTYSSVYKALDLETEKLVALKKVKFASMDPESVRFMAREILILRRLDHPNVIKLEGLIASRASGSLYLIFDYIEHDLSGLVATPDIKFSEAQIKCYMQQLLLGLEHCHSHGILHRDIKCSNLLIDNNSNLKIADFGLANFFQPNQEQPLTSRVVTLWYRPPELLLGATNYGVSVDLWSSGCILAELFTGKPILPGRTEVEQLHRIFKLCGSPSEEYWKNSKLSNTTIFKPEHYYERCITETFKDLPSTAFRLLEVLLAVEPLHRGTTSLALKNEFFTTQPLPCSPSSLPKYPPSKELNTKLRRQQLRRRRAASFIGPGQKSTSTGMKESENMHAPEADAKWSTLRQGQVYPRIAGEHPSSSPAESSKGDMNKARIYTAGLDQTDKIKNAPEFENQEGYLYPGPAEMFSDLSNLVPVPGDSYNGGDNTSAHFRATCNHEDDTEPSQILLDKQILSKKKSAKISLDPSMGRLHFSGPLILPGGNLDEMLKEHETRIQDAVRKARVKKIKPVCL